MSDEQSIDYRSGEPEIHNTADAGESRGVPVGPDSFIEWIQYFSRENQAALVAAFQSSTPTKINIEKNSRGYTFGVEVRQGPGETMIDAQERAKQTMTWLENTYGETAGG